LRREVAAGDPVVDQTPIADCRSRAFCIEVWVLMMAETLIRLGELSSFAALRSGDVWSRKKYERGRKNGAEQACGRQSRCPGGVYWRFRRS